MNLRRLTLLASLLTTALALPRTTIAAPHSVPNPGNPFAVDITVSLSPQAAARLAALHEAIVVSAAYSGEPAPRGRSHANQIGQIDLGSENVEAPGRPATVNLTGTTVNRAHLAWIRGPVLLNINIFSARHSGPDNILSCDFFDGKLAAATARPVPLHCSLITENQPTKHLP